MRHIFVFARCLATIGLEVQRHLKKAVRLLLGCEGLRLGPQRGAVVRGSRLGWLCLREAKGRRAKDKRKEPCEEAIGFHEQPQV